MSGEREYCVSGVLTFGCFCLQPDPLQNNEDLTTGHADAAEAEDSNMTQPTAGGTQAAAPELSEALADVECLVPHRSTLLGAEGVKARTQGQQQVTISADLERKIINRAAKRDVIDNMPRIQKSGFFEIAGLDGN